MKNILIYLILFFSVPIIATTAQAEPIKVNFAGFAFRGDHAQISKNYPRTLAISKEKLPDQRSLLDATLVDKVKELKFKNGEIVISKLANLNDGSLTLACCLDSELISIEQHDDGYKLVIGLGAQALLFDYSQMKVIASYPVMVELIDYLPTKPDENTISERVRDLLLTNKFGINLFEDFINILDGIEIKSSYGNAIKVTDVQIEDKALPFLPPIYSENLDNFKTSIAQNFGKFLSKNQGVSILPYTKGSDIGNKMAVRFSDSKVFELEIPEPQFAIELKIRGFKKVCTQKKSSGSSWVYGVFANIKISQLALGKTYLDEKIKYGVSKVIPSSQKTVQDWPIFQNSLVALFNDVTNKFSTERKYKTTRKVIAKCI